MGLSALWGVRRGLAAQQDRRGGESVLLQETTALACRKFAHTTRRRARTRAALLKILVKTSEPNATPLVPSGNCNSSL